MQQFANRSSALPRNSVVHFCLMFLAFLVGAEGKADCSAYLKAANTYDELVEGRLVEKMSIFDLTEWSPHSSYAMVLGTKTLPKNAELRLQIKDTLGGEKKAGLFQFKDDLKEEKKYLRADVEPIKWIGKNASAGYLNLEIHAAGKTLCQQQLLIVEGD